MTFPSITPPSDGSVPQSGITTIGYGLASAHATGASLQIVIINTDFYHGPPQAPRIESVPGTRARAAMAEVVTAIKTHQSVSSVDVVIPMITNGMGRPVAVARLDVDIVEPEASDLTLLLNDAARAAAESDLYIGHVGANFRGSNCVELVREAKRLAIANAREQAEVQAELLDVVLGAVIASADVQPEFRMVHGMFGSMLVPLDSCPPPLPANFHIGSGPGTSLAPFDPATQPIQVDAYRRVVMTFAIT
jgi:hypothetical protein